MTLQHLQTTLLHTLLVILLVTPGFDVHAEEAAPGKKDDSPWWDSKWPTRKKITIDTTDKGVPVADAVSKTAVLVRLHDGNFGFFSAKEDGSDLRFVADDGKTALKHHVEKWDTLLNEAYVGAGAGDQAIGRDDHLALLRQHRRRHACCSREGDL